MKEPVIRVPVTGVLPAAWATFKVLEAPTDLLLHYAATASTSVDGNRRRAIAARVAQERAG